VHGHRVLLLAFRQAAASAFQSLVVSASQHDGESLLQELATRLESQTAIGTRYERDT
jgi:hypothetical protein